MKDGQLWRQYIIVGVGIVNFNSTFIAACSSYAGGWTAPVAPKLRSPASSPLDTIPNSEQIAWMGSLLTIGALFGPFTGGAIASKFGRKSGLMTASITMMLGWILVAVAFNMTFLYAARVLFGFSSSIIYTLTTIYCAEIATDDVRGALFSLLQVLVTIGFLLVYSIGPYISYWSIAYVGIGSIAVFMVLFYFMPETPTYFLLNNDREAAASSLCTIRGRSRSCVEAELNNIEVSLKTAMEKPAISTKKTAAVRELFRGTNFKAFYISCALGLFQQFSGINAVLFYMTDIFQDSGIDLNPDIATIIIGTVQVVASLLTVFVVDRLGRRLLLLVSSFGAAVSLILLGMFFLLVANGSEVVTKISFLPVLSLVLFMVTYSCGLGPLPWAIMGELFSIEVKPTAIPITTVFNCLMAFLVTRFFEPIAIALGRYAAFWLFAAFCVVAFFFTIFLVPETKGKSFREIQDMLAEGKLSMPKERINTPVV